MAKKLKDDYSKNSEVTEDIFEIGYNYLVTGKVRIVKKNLLTGKIKSSPVPEEDIEGLKSKLQYSKQYKAHECN